MTTGYSTSSAGYGSHAASRPSRPSQQPPQVARWQDVSAGPAPPRAQMGGEMAKWKAMAIEKERTLNERRRCAAARPASAPFLPAQKLVGFHLLTGPNAWSNTERRTAAAAAAARCRH